MKKLEEENKNLKEQNKSLQKILQSLIIGQENNDENPINNSKEIKYEENEEKRK